MKLGSKEKLIDQCDYEHIHNAQSFFNAISKIRLCLDVQIKSLNIPNSLKEFLSAYKENFDWHIFKRDKSLEELRNL